MRVNQKDRDIPLGRIEFRADDETLTPHAGLAITGQIARRLDLIGEIDRCVAGEKRATPVKVRKRGSTPGQLLLALAESQLVGGECFDDLQALRDDHAGAPLRTVANVPAPPTARQNARRYRAVHVQQIERALAIAAGRVDRHCDRDREADATIDLDATQIEVHGRQDGAARSRHGCRAYAPHIAFWAQRGRALTSELVGGNREKLPAADVAKITRRAIGMLRASGHTGPLDVRADSAYYALDVLDALRAADARFTVSVPRSTAMWGLVDQVPEDAWVAAIDLHDAQVAEVAYRPRGWKHESLRCVIRRTRYCHRQISSNPRARRRKTLHPDQLALIQDGHRIDPYGYSFLISDQADQTAIEVEHHHRHRAQIEERLKDAKLGHALRRMPSSDLNANRLWATATLTALNLAALVCDLSPAAGASGQAPKNTPKRRHGKTLRRLFFNVPARLVRTGRKVILRLQAGYQHLDTITATYHAAHALPRPGPRPGR